MKLRTWNISTDATADEIEASTIDEAARIFAADEQFRGWKKVRGAKTLKRQIEKIGGWVHFSDEDGAPIGSL